MSLYQEDFTISPARTGDAVIKKLDVTGFTNTSNTDAGRVYWKVTTANVLEIYKEEGKTNRIMYGSVGSNDSVTLAEDNSSGMSGTCICVHTAGIGNDATSPHLARCRLAVPKRHVWAI